MIVIYYGLILLATLYSIYMLYVLFMVYYKKSKEYLGSIYISEILSKMNFVPENYRLIALLIFGWLILLILIHLVSGFITYNAINQADEVMKNYQKAMEEFNKVYK